jgi:hypothetical protein
MIPATWALGMMTGPPVGPVGSEAEVPDRDNEGAASAAPFVVWDTAAPILSSICPTDGFPV